MPPSLLEDMFFVIYYLLKNFLHNEAVDSETPSLEIAYILGSSSALGNKLGWQLIFC